MKIVIVSDTHRDLDVLTEIIETNRGADLFIHLGDGEQEFQDIQTLYPEKAMIYVAGNCDFGQHEQVHIAKFVDVRIFCCHGHTLSVNYGLGNLVATAKKNHCSIALYGHTHIPRTELIDGVMVMNPGSPDSPRGKNKPSYGIIEIEQTGEINMNIIELDENDV